MIVLFPDHSQFFGRQSNKRGFFFSDSVKNRAKRGFYFLDSVTVNTVVHTESESCQKQCRGGCFFRSKLIPPLDNCRYCSPHKRHPGDLNLNAAISRIWSFRAPTTIFRTKELCNPGMLPSPLRESKVPSMLTMRGSRRGGSRDPIWWLRMRLV